MNKILLSILIVSLVFTSSFGCYNYRPYVIHPSRTDSLNAIGFEKDGWSYPYYTVYGFEMDGWEYNNMYTPLGSEAVLHTWTQKCR